MPGSGRPRATQRTRGQKSTFASAAPLRGWRTFFYYRKERDRIGARGDDRDPTVELETFEILGLGPFTLSQKSAHPIAAVDVQRLRDDVVGVR